MTTNSDNYQNTMAASLMHVKDRDAPSKVPGDARSTKSTVLETGAALTQVHNLLGFSYSSVSITLSRTSRHCKTCAPISTLSMSTLPTPGVSSRPTTIAGT